RLVVERELLERDPGGTGKRVQRVAHAWLAACVAEQHRRGHREEVGYDTVQLRELLDRAGPLRHVAGREGRSRRPGLASGRRRGHDEVPAPDRLAAPEDPRNILDGDGEVAFGELQV